MQFSQFITGKALGVNQCLSSQTHCSLTLSLSYSLTQIDDGIYKYPEEIGKEDERRDNPSATWSKNMADYDGFTLDLLKR